MEICNLNRCDYYELKIINYESFDDFLKDHDDLRFGYTKSGNISNICVEFEKISNKKVTDSITLIP